MEFWVLVMPKADKSLRDYLDENIEHLSIDDTVKVLSDITQALVAIEERVVHRDIKPDNILLLDGRWCLADFGISRYAEATTALDTRKFAMTPSYAAPEQWRMERASSATDVYSLGVVAYELLAGQLPFVGPEVDDYRRQHLGDTPKSISGVPVKLQSLIDECLLKSPESRPRPQNLSARLKQSVWADSEGARHLQQANATVVKHRAEVARQESVAQSKAERRLELHNDAGKSLARILSLLNDQILSNADTAKQPGPTPQRSWSLNNATLSMASSKMAENDLSVGTYSPPFEIVSYSSITLQIKTDQYGFEGTSHSLWYCNAIDAEEFRWYETAFKISAFIPKRGRLNFFALDPGRNAYDALASVMGEYDVAWPLTTIDKGDESDFIARWLEWFGKAASGLLRESDVIAPE